MMMHILEFALALLVWIADGLFVTWFFWPLTFILIVVSYGLVSSVDDEWPVWPTFLALIVAFGIFYRFPEYRVSALDWHWWASYIGYYVVAGFIVATIKWIIVIYDFRKKSDKIRLGLERFKKGYSTWESWTHDRISEEITEYLRLDCSIRAEVSVNGAGIVSCGPDWRKSPIMAWWTYWPFFAISVLMDPLNRFLNSLVQWLRSFWSTLAKIGSVKTKL